MRYFFSLVLFILLLAPLEVTHAQLITCTEADQCNFCELIQTLDNVVNWVVIVATLIAVIGLMYAGFRMSQSRGDVSSFTAAKEMLGNIVIGIFLIMAAWMIVDTILKTLVGGDLGVWHDMERCGAGMLQPGTTDKNIVLRTDEVHVVQPKETVYGEDGPGSIIEPGGAEIIPYVGGGAEGSVSFSFSSSLAVAQQGHISLSLAALQACIARNVLGGAYVITSVSDNLIANGSKTWEECRAGQCQHTRNSCHYGGKSCTDGSYALDIRTSNLSSSQRSNFLQATRECGGYGQDEGDHLHVSIGQAAGCGCN